MSRERLVNEDRQFKPTKAPPMPAFSKEVLVQLALAPAANPVLAVLEPVVVGAWRARAPEPAVFVRTAMRLAPLLLIPKYGWQGYIAGSYIAGIAVLAQARLTRG